MTDKDKVDTLIRMNPKLTEKEACLLLGIDWQTYGRSEFLNIFEDIMKKKRNERT